MNEFQENLADTAERTLSERQELGGLTPAQGLGGVARFDKR